MELKVCFLWIIIPLVKANINNNKVSINRLAEYNKNMSSEIDEKVADTWATKREYFVQSKSTFKRKQITTPTIIDRTCLLIPDEGPCRASITMWFFNPEKRRCETFIWGGCQGNGNRFDKKTECLSACLSKPGFRAAKPNYCSLSFDYGWCFGAEERWFYDKRWAVCKKSIYSGCGGNKNNFYNREQCNSVCTFGNGPLHNTKKKIDNRIKKILVINPIEDRTQSDATTRNVVITTKENWWIDEFKNRNDKNRHVVINKEIPPMSSASVEKRGANVKKTSFQFNNVFRKQPSKLMVHPDYFVEPFINTGNEHFGQKNNVDNKYNKIKAAKIKLNGNNFEETGSNDDAQSNIISNITDDYVKSEADNYVNDQGDNDENFEDMASVKELGNDNDAQENDELNTKSDINEQVYDVVSESTNNGGGKKKKNKKDEHHNMGT